MHRAIRKQGVGTFLRQEGPSLVTAFAIAEMFYKFKSFALECLAFLATWYALSYLASLLAPLLRGPAGDSSDRV